ncbi:LysE family translocator [Vibrio viridaestus]|uniref:LysE family translocator n=1 Tax=Vibrio viridaestus TaxID=2487322 RepID=A0A3N9TDF0_9VIBR|nr:LysE family translocator [Vibrio viridaestus]RQW62211.1 LysE family translocator [Vibrio viridaestus]
MPEYGHLMTFCLVSLIMVLTPGPNMIYLISRSMCQGKQAGIMSLSGVLVGFIVYMLSAALGVTGLLLAVPYAYDSIRIAGVCYLLFLAYQAITNKKTLILTQDLNVVSRRKLFSMGFFTNITNPKIAMMYLSLLPQFITPGHNEFSQTLVLGGMQILISGIVNLVIVLTAGLAAHHLINQKLWSMIQRWLLSTVFGLMALNMAIARR